MLHVALTLVTLTPGQRSNNDSSCLIVGLFDWILYVPSTIFQLYMDGPSSVEPVLS